MISSETIVSVAPTFLWFLICDLLGVLRCWQLRDRYFLDDAQWPLKVMHQLRIYKG